MGGFAPRPLWHSPTQCLAPSCLGTAWTRVALAPSNIASFIVTVCGANMISRPLQHAHSWFRSEWDVDDVEPAGKRGLAWGSQAGVAEDLGSGVGEV